MAVKTEIMTQKASNSSYNAQDNARNLANIVSNELKGTEWTITPNGTDETIKETAIIITYTNSKLGKDKIDIGKPGENGKIEYTIWIKDQDADLVVDSAAGFGAANLEYIDKFGKIIEGYSIAGIWRLFYADTKNAYLIRDSIGNQALESISGFGTSTISSLGKNLNSKYISWERNKANRNIKGPAVLLDTTKWIEYRGDEANWAIGAPTVEIFIASYNSTHTIQLDCKVTTTGYKIGKSISGETVTNYDDVVGELGNTKEIDKAIYCHSSKNWWLATPGGWSGYHIMSVHSKNGGSLDGKYNYGYELRPLVCIPISKIGNGIMITENY